jgi:prepilin-type N-terminal cleavage/methylation domain-containing protein
MMQGKRSLTIWRFASEDVDSTGFTLLELIIAMSLLGVLLAAGWTLMGTFSQVQQRGWDLAARTQTRMSVRSWLQQDLQRATPLPTAKQTRPSALNDSPREYPHQQPSVRFVGSETGFSVMVNEALNPQTLLQAALDHGDQSASWTSDSNSVDNRFSGSRRLMVSASSLDQPIEVRYELRPSGTENYGNQSKEISTLCRQELRAAKRSLPAEQPLAADNRRELTAADLYRQTDESQEQYSEAEQSLDIAELVEPAFSYCDGRQWRSSWDSRTGNRLPTAVALSFDLKNRAAKQAQEPANRSISSSDNANPSVASSDPKLSASDLRDSPNTAEKDLQSRDVRIVIRLDNAFAVPMSSQSTDARSTPGQNPGGTQDAF